MISSLADDNEPHLPERWLGGEKMCIDTVGIITTYSVELALCDVIRGPACCSTSQPSLHALI